MKRIDVLLSVIERANVGGALSPEDAISNIAYLIDRLDKLSPAYERDVEALLRVGACVWIMQRQT